MKFKIGRAKDDPEKLVTPGIVYCTKEIDGRRGSVLALGWWDWSIKLLWLAH